MKRAIGFLIAAAACVTSGGWLLDRSMHITLGHGVYCALGTAATVGCDTNAITPQQRIISSAVILTCVPLLTTAFGLLLTTHIGRRIDTRSDVTIALVRRHVTDAMDAASRELHAKMEKHHQEQLDRLDNHAASIKAHVTASAAAPEPSVNGEVPAPGTARRPARRKAGDGM